MRAAGSDLNGRSTVCFLSIRARQQQRSLASVATAPGLGAQVPTESATNHLNGRDMARKIDLANAEIRYKTRELK